MSRVFGGLVKWSCSVIGGLALLCFFFLAWSGHQGKIKIPGVEISIQPSERTISAACQPLLPEVDATRQALNEEGHRLDLMEAAAVEYERKYNIPNDPRGWVEVGRAESQRQWKDIEAHRKIFSEYSERIFSILQDARQRCML
jgi:hypothetical protein